MADLNEFLKTVQLDPIAPARPVADTPGKYDDQIDRDSGFNPNAKPAAKPAEKLDSMPVMLDTGSGNIDVKSEVPAHLQGYTAALDSGKLVNVGGMAVASAIANSERGRGKAGIDFFMTPDQEKYMADNGLVFTNRNADLESKTMQEGDPSIRKYGQYRTELNGLGKPVSYGSVDFSNEINKRVIKEKPELLRFLQGEQGLQTQAPAGQ